MQAALEAAATVLMFIGWDAVLSSKAGATGACCLMAGGGD
jgi:hypothetical protein